MSAITNMVMKQIANKGYGFAKGFFPNLSQQDYDNIVNEAMGIANTEGKDALKNRGIDANEVLEKVGGRNIAKSFGIQDSTIDNLIAQTSANQGNNSSNSLNRQQRRALDKYPKI